MFNIFSGQSDLLIGRQISSEPDEEYSRVSVIDDQQLTEKTGTLREESQHAVSSIAEDNGMGGVIFY